MTNGDDILFIKLVLRSPRHYALSQVFAPLTSSQELQNALQILKRLVQVIGEGVG